jgi:hypothetical protein
MSAPAGVKIRRVRWFSHQYKRLFFNAFAPYIMKARPAAKWTIRRLFAVYALYRYEEHMAASMGVRQRMTSGMANA